MEPIFFLVCAVAILGATATVLLERYHFPTPLYHTWGERTVEGVVESVTHSFAEGFHLTLDRNQSKMRIPFPPHLSPLPAPGDAVKIRCWKQIHILTRETRLLAVEWKPVATPDSHRT